MVRVEDFPLVLGAGCFVDDLTPKGCLHAAFLRSAYAHARIDAIALESARESPGVVGVFTGEDLKKAAAPTVNSVLDGQPSTPAMTILAEERVTAVGQPIAVVVAGSRTAAIDAAELIDVTYTPLTPKASLDSGALDLVDDADDRVAAQTWSKGDVDSAFEVAEHVVRMRIIHPRLAPSPMEPRALLAWWDDEGDRLEVRASSQSPHRVRADVAQALDLPKDLVRVKSPDVGGAFGMKASIYPEELVTCWLAFKLRAPVKWTAFRSDDFLAASQGRGAVSEGELAVDRDGRMMALRARITCPLGFWLPYSALIPAWNAGRILPGPYGIEAVNIQTEARMTTTAPVGIYRGAGRPEAAMLMERLAEEAARLTGLDPAELRRRNLIAADRLPCRRPTGVLLDSGDYGRLLAESLAFAGYDDMVRKRDRHRSNGDLFGIGLAFYVEPCGQGWETARLKLEPDGRVTAVTGSTAQGQGRTTAVLKIMTEALGLPAEAIMIHHGDTDLIDDGIGAVASRSTPIGGSALIIAAETLIGHARSALAQQHDLPIDSIRFENGVFHLPKGVGIDWRGLADLEIDRDALDVSITYEAEGEAFGYGCCIAAVTIDQDTGVLTVSRLWHGDDAGVQIEPKLVEGQLIGGIAQGVGEALLERIIYDESGQLLTGSLMDYALPRASHMPPVELASKQTRSPLNRLGAKGVGEAGCIGTPAAILNAAHDALAPLGRADIDTPLTSEKIWRAITTLRKKEGKR